MRTRHLIGLTVVAVIACGGESRGQNPTVSVETEYLATVEAPLEPAQPAGSRVIVNVPTGGTVRGPKINGTIVAPAGDWLTVMPDGSRRLDVRATIKTDNGESLMPLLPARSIFCKGEAGARRQCRGGIGMRRAGCAGG